MGRNANQSGVALEFILITTIGPFKWRVADHTEIHLRDSGKFLPHVKKLATGEYDTDSVWEAYTIGVFQGTADAMEMSCDVYRASNAPRF